MIASVARRSGPTMSSTGLSRREREVAELVTGGMTNREIAGALFLSVKTVESHVSSILEKAGISSRTALAGALARRGRRDRQRPAGSTYASRPTHLTAA